MAEFVGLRAKAYSFTISDHQREEFFRKSYCTKKLKSIKKSVVEKEIFHEHYRSCLLDNIHYRARINKFQSQKHKITTITQIKSALVNFDDKRYITTDNITTLAHGHQRAHRPVS